MRISVTYLHLLAALAVVMLVAPFVALSCVDCGSCADSRCPDGTGVHHLTERSACAQPMSVVLDPCLPVGSNLPTAGDSATFSAPAVSSAPSAVPLRI